MAVSNTFQSWYIHCIYSLRFNAVISYVYFTVVFLLLLSGALVLDDHQATGEDSDSSGRAD